MTVIHGELVAGGKISLRWDSGSSKDAGINLMTAISEITDPDFIAFFDTVI